MTDQEKILAETAETLDVAYADMQALGAVNQVRQAFGMTLLSADDVDFVDGQYGREMHLANGCPCGHNSPTMPAPVPAVSVIHTEPTRLTWWQALKIVTTAMVGEIRAWLRRSP